MRYFSKITIKELSKAAKRHLATVRSDLFGILENIHFLYILRNLLIIKKLYYKFDVYEKMPSIKETISEMLENNVRIRLRPA